MVGNLKVVSPAPRQVWREILASDAEANIYQTPAWLDAICAAGGYQDSSRLYVTAAGEQLVLPMVRRTGMPQVLTVEESLPADWGTGGLVATSTVQSEDITAVWRDLVTQRVAGIRMRPENQTAAAWDAAQAPPSVKVTRSIKHVINLDGGFESVWAERFKGKARTAVRKAERAGLVVEWDSSDRFVREYYDLYRGWTSRRADEQGLPKSLMLRRAEPLRKYQAVAEKLGVACRIWIARLDQEPIAAIITLIHGDYANYWRGCSNKELSGPVRANDLLQQFAIEYACKAGCRYYNMGWTPTDSLAAFKRSFGALPCQFPVYTLDRLPLTQMEDFRSGLARRAKRFLKHCKA
ncbi:MAG: GNAT family N-acetyltransferase [Pseudonocardiaceae bacterium]